MKKILTLILCVTLSLSLTACTGKMPWDKEESVMEAEGTETTPPPTLEETLGFDGYDLMEGGITYKYQEVNLKADTDFTVSVNGRSVRHNVKITTVHEADENKSYSVIASSDTTEVESTSSTLMAYIIVNDDVEYYNYDYAGWKYKVYNTDDQYYHYNISRSNMNITLFEQQGDRLYVEGSVTTLGESDFDKYIKHVLSQYGVVSGDYTFRAVFDSVTREMLMITAEVHSADELHYGDYSGTLDNLNVSVTKVEGNDVDLITIPQYVFNVTMPVENTQSETEQQDVSNVSLCEYLLGASLDSNSIAEYLGSIGITVETLSNDTGLDGQVIYDQIINIISTYSYDNFITVDLSTLSQEQQVAFSYVSTMLQQQPTENDMTE